MAKSPQKPRDLRSSVSPEELNLQAGIDPVLGMMVELNLPLTREQYLESAYGLDLPANWSAELEAELPEMFQN
jgi:hypothetical protein